MSSRSLNVAPQHKQKVKDALKRNNFRSQQAFATEMGVSRDTVRKFVNGHNIDRNNFIDFCEQLGLDWQEMQDKPSEINTDPNFVGREKAIATLDNLINKKNGKVINIYGVGGVGKTSLAKQYLKAKGFEVLEVFMATKTEDITPVTFIVEEWLKNDLKVEPSQDFNISLKRLKEQLKTRKVGILIDNLETALKEGKLIEKHHQYVDLLKVLADADVQSLTLITSRERLTESEVEVEYYPLEGLDQDAWAEYFNYHQLIIDSSTVTVIRNAYGGNAKAMTFICKDIALDYRGDMQKYWQDHQRNLLANPTLKHLVTSQFDRLEKQNPTAYKLLLRLGCYHYQDISSVSWTGVKYLLCDLVDTNEKLRVIERLKERALVEHKKGEYWLHPVIKQEALKRLENSPDDYKKAHKIAAEYWKESVETILTVDDALKAFEAYYHYFDIEDYDQAFKYLIYTRPIPLDNLDVAIRKDLGISQFNDPLYVSCNRLSQSNKIKDAVFKIKDKDNNSDKKCIAYYVLGDISQMLGNYEKAKQYYEASGNCAKDSNNKQFEMLKPFDLGLCCIDRWELKEAQNHFNESLTIAKKYHDHKYSIRYQTYSKIYLHYIDTVLQTKDKHIIFVETKETRKVDKQDLEDFTSWGFGYCWLMLGFTYFYLEQYEEAFKRFDCALKFAESISYGQVKGKALYGIAMVKRKQKQYQESLKIHQESIELLEKIESKYDIAEAYYQLGLTYKEMKEMAKSQEYFDKAIELFYKIDAPKQVERVQTEMSTLL